MTRTRNTACTTPASGLVAPLRMLVAVRATAPVAANPPNKRRQDVGGALPDQFLVRIVPRARHAVGDDGRQQRLDRTEQRDRECRTDELQHLGERQARPLQGGQGPRNAAERGANRRDTGKLPDRLDGRRRKHRDERRRHAPEPGNPVKYPAADRDDRKREQRNARRRQVKARQRLDQRPDLLVEMFAGNGRLQAEEILPLPDEDDHGDTRREADDHGIRDEADHAPKLREPHREQHHARHQGRDLQSRDPVLRGDAGEHDDEGAGRPGDLHASPAQKRSRESGDDGRVEPLFGLRAGSDCEGHRKRQRHDADDDARDEVSPDLGADEEARAVRFEQGDHRRIRRSLSLDSRL